MSQLILFTLIIIKTINFWKSDLIYSNMLVKYSVRFSLNRSLPLIGLVSYPSSGNTWIRYLIEGLTGYFTGSMYNDNVIGKKGKFHKKKFNCGIQFLKALLPYPLLFKTCIHPPTFFDNLTPTNFKWSIFPSFIFLPKLNYFVNQTSNFWKTLTVAILAY